MRWKRKNLLQTLSNAELYDTLKRWRNMICTENDQPIYMVANQASLQEIALTCR